MKTSWTRLSSSSSEDVFNTSSRRLDQDEYVRLTLTSSEDVFKTSSRGLGQDQYIRFGYTSSRRLQDVLKTSSRRLANGLQDIFKTSSRRFEDVFKTSSRPLEKRLQDIFKTSSRRIIKLTRLWEAFNTFLRHSFPKTTIYRGLTLLLINLWSVYKICKRDKNLSSFSFSIYYTFSGCI